MNNIGYRRILYFTGIVIFITLGIQIYWNYRNYEAGKQQLINEVQISLDNAVEEYYASDAQRKTRLTFPNSNDVTKMEEPTVAGGDLKITNTTAHVDSSSHVQVDIEGKNFVLSKSDTLGFKNLDLRPVKVYGSKGLQDHDNFTILKDDTTYKELEAMVGKIIYSLARDTLDLQKMDSLLSVQLKRKDIEVDFGLIYRRQNEKFEQKSNPENIRKANLITQSKSTWLPSNTSLFIHFTNGTATILKQNLFGIILSALLITSVIGCLLFLLKIINTQKQHAEIKNDFISNLTHEFKTPIATIKVALEGLLFFNKNNDPEKTAKYVKASNDQLEKLNQMVEKLLEVATLNSSQLKLEKENIELVTLLQILSQKYKTIAPEKSFLFLSEPNEVQVKADPFHLENALNNIIDNAVKYGGGNISISVIGREEDVEIIISDSGNTLTKEQTSQIFEKFYRVPKGNTHDVKGYGIGLFHTKQIIERHGGNIHVELGKRTDFKIFLPYS